MRQRGSGILRTAAGAASLALLLSATSVSASAGLMLRLVRSADQGAGPNSLAGVAALSATDAWAVGVDAATVNGPTSGLAEHWDGHAWSLVSLPQPSGSPVALAAVAGSATNDVWAVGWQFVNGNGMSLTEHWNGSSWSIVPSPNVGGSGFLVGVTALAANQAWAVGFWDDSNGFPNPLVEHWDGVAWTVQTAPATGSLINQFNGVKAISAADVWAVGVSQDPEFGESDALIEHYDGTAWTIVTVPASRFVTLAGVAATAANDVWAVGSRFGNGTAPADGLIEHWDGRAWAAVPSLDPATFDLALNGIVAQSPTDAWAVGASHQTSTSPGRSFAEHWDGAHWGPVAIGLGPANHALFGVAEAAGGQVFAAGVRSSSSAADRTLILANCAPCAAG